jgi:uncharacterized damage-inducible protein DinB
MVTMKLDRREADMLRSRYTMLADYNRWANARLYDAAAQLSDSDYRADRGAFFRSVHGTLNHLLLTDRVWMGRFSGETVRAPALDSILHDDLPTLAAERVREDATIQAFVRALDAQRLGSVLRYARASATTVYSQPLWTALDHFFNHQTHHRGQIHAILTGLGARAPELDLIFFQREAGFSHAEPGT